MTRTAPGRRRWSILRDRRTRSRPREVPSTGSPVGSRPNRESVPRTGTARPAVAVEEVVDPRARAAERAVGRRDVDQETALPPCGAGARVDAHPHARLVGDLAAPEVGAPARAVPEVLRAGLRAHVLEMAQDAVAARPA